MIDGSTVISWPSLGCSDWAAPFAFLPHPPPRRLRAATASCEIGSGRSATCSVRESGIQPWIAAHFLARRPHCRVLPSRELEL